MDMPAGDIGRAFLLVRTLSEDQDESRFSDEEYQQAALESGGAQDDLLRGLGTLIDVFMSMFRPGGALDLSERKDGSSDEDAMPEDPLHTIVPAVVAKLSNQTWVVGDAIPTMAGALTAAAMGGSSYRWRSIFGPWHAWEFVPFTYTAVFLASLVDLVSGRPGYALRLVEDLLLDDNRPR
jgi:hypothetical protein